jgi:hypothetical protein
MRQKRPVLKGLWHAFDEATFGHDRTLNLRESLPSAADARARAESWLRMRQVMKSGEVLVVTGRGNQSPNGIGVVREAILGLMPSLRRRGIVKSWREHSPGSIVVTLAPVADLLSAPKRNRERNSDENAQSIPAVPVSLAALEPETLALLRRLALETIESLGVRHAEDFVEQEMQAIFAKLSVTLPVSGDREGTLRRAISSAIEDVESAH